MIKPSTVLIVSALAVLTGVLYVTFVNPIKIDKTCGGFAGEICDKSFFCKMPKQSLGSADVQGFCVPYHLALLPYRAFIFEPSTQILK